MNRPKKYSESLSMLSFILISSSVLADTINVTTIEDVENPRDGLCSLREATKSIDGSSVDSSCSLVSSSENIINLSSATYCLNKAIELSSSLSLKGVSGGSTVLDGGNGSTTSCSTKSGDRVIAIESEVSATLENVTVQGGQSSLLGAGILVNDNASLNLNSVTVRDNSLVASSSASGGAGLFAESQVTLIISNSYFNSNVLSCSSSTGGNCGNGAGINVGEGSTITISNSVFSDNRASTLAEDAAGGAINVKASSSEQTSLSISQSTFSRNSVSGGGDAGASGGAINVEYGATVSISDSSFDNNTAKATNARAFGGAIAVTHTNSLSLARVEIQNSLNEVTASSVGAYGGGMFIANVSTVSIGESTFSSNKAIGLYSAYGGGLYLSNASATLSNITISGNTSEGGKAYAGGLFVKVEDIEEEVPVYLSFSTIAYNNAVGTTEAYGGGIGHLPSTQSNARLEKIYFMNSIVALNDASSSATAKGDNCYQTNYSGGYNIIGDDTDCTIESYSASGEVKDHVDADPLLNALADNGGNVLTHALQSSSPARGQANCWDWSGAKVNLDARGLTRDIKCDIGAFEYPDLDGRRKKGAGQPTH